MNDQLVDVQSIDDLGPVHQKLTFDGPKGPLFKAMAEARKHFKPLRTEATADVQGVSKSGKAFNYQFSYAPLDVVLDALEPGLSAAGIALMQPFDGDVLYTIVACGDSSMTIETPLPQWGTPQELGSLLTYLRRYQVKGIFGVADSEDDDGNAASGNTAKIDRKEPRASQPSGPAGVSEENRKLVTAAGKSAELNREGFLAFVQSALNKPWDKCTDKDVPLLLKALEAKQVMS